MRGILSWELMKMKKSKKKKRWKLKRQCEEDHLRNWWKRRKAREKKGCKLKKTNRMIKRSSQKLVEMKKSKEQKR